MKINPQFAMAAISKSKDVAWLSTFQSRMKDYRQPALVAAIENRLVQIRQDNLEKAIGKPDANMTLPERVWETIRVYEELLFLTHGTRRRATGTRPMIKRSGEVETVRRSVSGPNGSSSLALLAQYDRVDCSFEQIVLDFPQEFDLDLVTKVQAHLATLVREPVADLAAAAG